MIELRKGNDRGRTTMVWLDSWHSFSFNDYYDPANNSFGPLRVLNDDVIMPGQGFPLHGHRDMEIVTYVLRGALEHKDSTGSSGVIRACEVQRMSAGSGIEHSESNHSDREPVHLLQIWFQPDERGLDPSYEVIRFTDDQQMNSLLPVASGQRIRNAVHISLDATMYVSGFVSGSEVTHRLGDGRGAYVYLIAGGIQVGDQSLSGGDAAKVRDEASITIKADEDSELVLFDVLL